jgi:hypothetical protein
MELEPVLSEAEHATLLAEVKRILAVDSASGILKGSAR